MRRFAMALVAVMAVGASAQAQVIVREPDRYIYKTHTFIDGFPDVKIVGEIERPEGQIVMIPPTPKFPSLIKIRSNFTPELTKSIDQL